jgi:glutathione synthase/RimK-type ligase-like ATP-grasp enzyme
VVDWDDKSVDWSAFDCVVIRSTWDYYSRLDEFQEWLMRVSQETAVHNFPEVVQWNIDKRYLLELEEEGIPVIPTTFISSTSEIAFAPLDADVMVKPVISAGSNDTARFVGDPIGAQKFAEGILASGRAVMVQPYVSAIDEHGEIGLVYFAGEISHAFHKGPIFRDNDLSHNGLYMEEVISPHEATLAEQALGDRVMAMLANRFDSPPLYARVDMVESENGAPSIMEVELIEPSLFLHVDDASADHLARVLAGLNAEA